MYSTYPETIDPVYALHAHESRSSRYSFINTGDIINTFNNNGFEVSNVTYPKLRKHSKEGYQHHLVRMRPTNPYMYEGEVPEVIIMNSHDGTKAFRLGLGFFRFVCSNGLIAGDFLADTGRVLHKGNIQDTVLEYIGNFSKNVTEKIRHITEMKTITLSLDERAEFASKSAELINPSIKNPYELLFVNRLADKEPTLWNTFNVIQENAMKGNFNVQVSDNKQHKARPVNNITRKVSINTNLWNLAEEYID